MPQARILVSQSALEKNLRALIQNTGGWSAFPVLKANAYGLGFKEVASCFENSFSLSEVPYFCLARVYELEQALAASTKRKFLLLSEWPEKLQDLPLDKVEICVTSFEDLEVLTQYQEPVSFHLKLNTGMNRLGFRIGDILCSSDLQGRLEKLFIKIKQRGHRLRGILSHLSMGEDRRSRFTVDQEDQFDQGVVFIKSLWKEDIPWIHLSNSPGVLNKIGSKIKSINAFRPGIHLWGVQDPQKQVKIVPVAQIRAPLRQLMWIQKGEGVGYGRRFVASQKTRVGILNMGYADGLRRDSWKLGLSFFYEGKRVPFLGTVSMDMCAVDCTKIKENIPLGSEFEWVGEKQSLEKIADAQKTIPYEILTSLSARVERVVV
jgi:alanine racemase